MARGFAQKALPAVAPNQLPREVAEAWAGVAVALLVGEMIRLGFTGGAYECAPTGKDSYLPEGDIERRENQVELDEKISSRTLYQLHLAPCCTSGSLAQNLNTTTRTLETPECDGSLEHELRGNASMAVALWLFWRCLLHGVYVTFEHPIASRVWALPFMKYVTKGLDLVVVDPDQCAYGKRPSDWTPDQGDLRTLKGTRLIGNNPSMRALERRCSDTDRHSHRAVIGKSDLGESRASEAAAYPKQMDSAHAFAVRTAWLRGISPVPLSLWLISLEDFRANLALEPSEWKGKHNASNPPVTLRPTAVGGSSRSSGVAEGVRDPKRDYWVEIVKQWIRMHVEPRHTYHVLSAGYQRRIPG